MVRETGLEPVWYSPHAPQTCASASSATLAYLKYQLIYYSIYLENVKTFFQKSRFDAKLKCLQGVLGCHI